MFSDRTSVKNADKKKFDFSTKRHGLTPLKNDHFLALVKTSIFWSYNLCFLSRISNHDFFSHNFCKKHPYEKVRFFYKIHGVTLCKMSIFWPFLKLQFFMLKIILFFPQYQKRCFLIEFLWKTPIRKSSIFRQNAMD